MTDHRFHLSNQVDSTLRDRRTAFCLLDPDQLARYVFDHWSLRVKCVRQHPGDPNSCFLMSRAGRPLARHFVLRFQTLLSREIGVTVAEFQSYINPDISGPELTKSPPNPYYDSELKRIYQNKFRARCVKNDRCMNPSHFVLFYDGQPYTVADDPAPLPLDIIEHVLSRSHRTILKDAETRARGAKRRIPFRVNRLRREIEFCSLSGQNDVCLQSCTEKLNRIFDQENRIDDWMQVLKRYRNNPNDEDLQTLLNDLPNLKP